MFSRVAAPSGPRSCDEYILKAGSIQLVFSHEEFKSELKVILGQYFLDGGVFHFVGKGKGRSQHPSQFGQLLIQA